MIRLLVAFGLLVTPIVASAAPSDLGRGAIVGGVSLGSEVAGVLGGALVGGSLGAAACRPNAFECFGTFIGAGFGGVVGGLAGAPIGGGVAAHHLGAHPGRVVGWTLLGEGAGAAIFGVGLATGSEGLIAGGVAVAALGSPLLAGLAAGTDHDVHAPYGPVVSVAPILGRTQNGLLISVSGF